MIAGFALRSPASAGWQTGSVDCGGVGQDTSLAFNA